MDDAIRHRGDAYDQVEHYDTIVWIGITCKTEDNTEKKHNNPIRNQEFYAPMQQIRYFEKIIFLNPHSITCDKCEINTFTWFIGQV